MVSTYASVSAPMESAVSGSLPFISSLITVPTGKAAQKSLSNANALSCTQHTQAGSLPQPFYSIPPSPPTPCPQHTHTTCSSDCLPGRPDSGQIIFSSTRRLINTKTPHYSGLMQNKPGKLVRRVPIQAAFSSYSLV